MNTFNKHLPEKLGLWLIGLMWTLPFLSPRHRLPIPSFYSELIAVLLGMAGMLALLPRATWQNFELPRIALLPLGIFCLILLQMALGMVTFPQMGLIAAEYLLWACLLMVLGHKLRQTLGWEKFCATLAGFLVAGGLLGAILGLLQKAGIHWHLLFPGLSAQIFGNLAQRNHFADYTALALGSLIYLAARRALPKWFVATLALVLLATLGLSASRSSWLYLVAFAALAAILHRANPTGQSRWLMRACLIGLPAFALIQPLEQWLFDLWGFAPSTLVSERFLAEVSGSQIRLRIWRDALQMFVQHPWLGVGYGQFAWNSFLLAGSHAAGEITQPAEHAHNLPLHLLAEFGISAGLLLAWSSYAWIAGMAREKMTLESWWAWALLAVLGIHSLLEYPLWYSFFLGIAAILLGAGETRLLRPDFSRIGRPALAAMLVVGLYGVAGLAQSYAELENWVDRANSRNIKDSDLAEAKSRLLRLRKESMLTPYVEVMFAIALTTDPDYLDDKLLLCENTQRFAPLSEVAYKYAELLRLKGDPERADRQLQLAKRAYP